MANIKTIPGTDNDYLVVDENGNMISANEKQKENNSLAKPVFLSLEDGKWKFSDPSTAVEDMDEYFKEQARNKTLPKQWEYFKTPTNKNNPFKGVNEQAARNVAKRYQEILDKYGVTSYKDLAKLVENGTVASLIQEEEINNKSRRQTNDIENTGSAPSETTVRKTESGSEEVVTANPLATKEERKEAADEASKIVKEKEEKQEEPPVIPEMPVRSLNDIMAENGLDIYTTDFNTIEGQAELQSLYENMSKEDRKIVDKEMKNLAPTLQAAWEETKGNNANVFQKAWKKWINGHFSDEAKREEWLMNNPNPISAIWGESGLNAGERLALGIGLFAALASDYLRAPGQEANAVSNYMKPFNDINDKNIERITKMKDSANASEAEMEKKISDYKQDSTLKDIPRSTLSSLITFFENPDNTFSAETMAEYEDDFQKAYEQKFHTRINEENLADYNAWKAQTLKHFISKQGINPSRLENAGKFLDLDIKKADVANQVHKLNFNNQKDYVDLINELSAQKTNLVKEKAELVNYNETQLLDLISKARAAKGGLVTESESESLSESEGKTNGWNVSASVGADLKVLGKGVDGNVSGGGSGTSARSKGENTTLARTKDAALDEILKYETSAEVRRNIDRAKQVLEAAYDERIADIDTVINSLKIQMKKAGYGAYSADEYSSDARLKTFEPKEVSFDDKLKNLYETGFYSAPVIKDIDYFKLRLGLI